MRFAIAALLFCVAAWGCDAESGPGGAGAPADGAGTQEGEGGVVTWPGGSVKFGKDGVQVEAPGVDVDARPGEGVKVRAPGVDVDTETNKRVRVRAPGVDVDAQRSDPNDQGAADIKRQDLVAEQAPEFPITERSAPRRSVFRTVAFAQDANVKQLDLQRKSLMAIPPGTRFNKQPPQGWSTIIAFVQGRLASGDFKSVSDTVQYYAKVFNLVMLANAEKGSSGGYVLDKVAVGFSMKINGVNTVVTSATQAQLGADLSFIGSSVLDGNVEAIKKVQQVARNDASMVIDAPAFMLIDGDHKEMTVRYLVWASPTDGRIGTVVWLLDHSNAGDPPVRDYVVAQDTFQFLPANMQEDRVMNVKADRFTLGIPSADAFALVRIPQGRAPIR